MKEHEPMNDPMATPRQNDRHDQWTDAHLNAGLQWLAIQGATPWMARFKTEGDFVHADTRGMPPIVRQMLFDQFAALEAMPAEQVREYLAGSVEDRIVMVDVELTGLGR